LRALTKSIGASFDFFDALVNLFKNISYVSLSILILFFVAFYLVRMRASASSSVVFGTVARLRLGDFGDGLRLGDEGLEKVFSYSKLIGLVEFNRHIPDTKSSN